MENFIDTYNVSRETYAKLESYHQSLVEWQQKFNLVANSTLENAWERHFEDSAQLFHFIPKEAKTLVDIGSGAGFPAMVLGVMAAELAPQLRITLVESVHKKTVYLNHVKELTSAPVNILNRRIESLREKTFDVVTARAVINLRELLAYAQPLFRKNTLGIFPKGKNFQEEIKEARKDWFFDVEAVPSTTSEESVVLLVRNLFKKGRR